MYPPVPHPQTWNAVHRQVALNRVWLHVHRSGCDGSIWAKIEGNWPELFELTPMHTYLQMCSNLVAAAVEYATLQEFLDSFDRYVVTYVDVKNMGFDVTDETVCRLIMISRCDMQSTCNALLTLHA
jgi:hypothetical protein